jgi:hypothetical protein
VSSEIWRDLSVAEVKEFVQWAIDNWKPNTEISIDWNPVVRFTWVRLDASFATAKVQILADCDLYKGSSERPDGAS